MLNASNEAAQVAPAELKGRRPRDTSELSAVVGQSQDDLQMIREGDRVADRLPREARADAREERIAQERAARLAKRETGIRDREGNIVFENPIQGWKPEAGDFEVVEGRDKAGNWVEKFVPRAGSGTPGVRDALAQLQQANVAATHWYRPGGIRGASEVIADLEQTLSGGRDQRDIDMAAGRALVRDDNQAFNPVGPAAKQNNLDVAVEAEQIRRGIASGDVLGTGGFQGQQILNNIVPQQRSFNVADAATVQGTYIDPRTGTPIVMEEPVTTAIAGANTPDSAQMLNAPKESSSISWVSNNLPQANAFESSGGDLPQVGINEPTQLFASRLKALKNIGPGLQGISSNVRSVGEFEKAINYVIDAGRQHDLTFRTFKDVEQADGSFKRQPGVTKNPGAEEVMDLLRYTPAEKKALAGALYQLEMAKQAGAGGSVSDAFFARQSNPRGVADVRFDSPDAMPNPNMGETSAPLARISPGLQIERQLVRPQLAMLGDINARDPVIGQVQGEPSRINRRAPGGVSPSNLDAHFAAQEVEWSKDGKYPVNVTRGQQKAADAKIAIARAVRDEEDRAVGRVMEQANQSLANERDARRVREEREFGDPQKPTRRILGRPF